MRQRNPYQQGARRPGEDNALKTLRPIDRSIVGAWPIQDTSNYIHDSMNTNTMKNATSSRIKVNYIFEF